MGEWIESVVEGCSGIRHVLLLAKRRGENFCPEVRTFLKVKYETPETPPPSPDGNNNYHDTTKKTNKIKSKTRRKRIIESSGGEDSSDDSDANFIDHDPIVEFDSDSSGELRFDELQSELESEAESLLRAESSSDEEYMDDVPVDTEYVLEDKNFVISNKSGADLLEIFIALQDHCSWKRLDKYTFKLTEEELFSIKCDPTPEQRGKSKLYFYGQVLSWTKIAPTLYTDDSSSKLPEEFLRFLREPIAESPPEGDDNYAWKLHIFLRILLEISRRVEGESYPMKRWEVVNGIVLALSEWNETFDITRLFRHVETTRLEEEFDERRRFYDSLVQHDLQKSTRNLITISYMEYNSSIGRNKFVKLDGMLGKHLVSYFLTLSDVTTALQKQTKTFVLGGQDIFKFTIRYDESDTLEYVGESDDNDTAHEALFADMWLARFGEFLKTPIPVTYRQSDTSLFVALFAMAYKTACVIEEYQPSMNITSTCGAVYGAIDQFCTNVFNQTLVAELMDGVVTNLTELAEGRGDVSHYR